MRITKMRKERLNVSKLKKWREDKIKCHRKIEDLKKEIYDIELHIKDELIETYTTGMLKIDWIKLGRFINENT